MEQIELAPLLGKRSVMFLMFSIIFSTVVFCRINRRSLVSAGEESRT